MDEDTRALLIEADSCLSLLLYRHVRRDGLPPMLEYEIQDLLGKLRNAVK